MGDGERGDDVVSGVRTGGATGWGEGRMQICRTDCLVRRTARFTSKVIPASTAFLHLTVIADHVNSRSDVAHIQLRDSGHTGK